MRRIKQVVLENMATVQKVAFLLGENAARTEAMLKEVQRLDAALDRLREIVKNL